MGDCVLWIVFWKLHKQPTLLGYVSRSSGYALIVSEKGLGYILGDFSRTRLGPMLWFLNIFAEKFCKKLAFLSPNKAKFWNIFDHNIGI
jgi:hypothetical protein